MKNLKNQIYPNKVGNVFGSGEEWGFDLGSGWGGDFISSDGIWGKGWGLDWANSWGDGNGNAKLFLYDMAYDGSYLRPISKYPYNMLLRGD